MYVWVFFTHHLHEWKGRFIGETVANPHIRYCTGCSNWTSVEQEDGLDGLWWSLPILHINLWICTSAMFSYQKLKIFLANTALSILTWFVWQCSWYGAVLRAKSVMNSLPSCSNHLLHRVRLWSQTHTPLKLWTLPVTQTIYLGDDNLKGNAQNYFVFHLYSGYI